MRQRLKILSISAEAVPYAKTGGLGDVCGSLPKALRALGHDVRVAMPAYQSIEQSLHTGQFGLSAMPGQLNVPLRGATLPAGVLRGVLPGSDVPVYFIAERSLFDRPKIYGYDDDAYRFAFFSRAALDLIPALNWKPDVVHCHDWHSAAAAMWLATEGRYDSRFQGIPTLYTIHNLAHQGRTRWDITHYLNIKTDALREEPHDQINFMARGIYHSTLVNTVSPTYAREIMTESGGGGLEGLLRYRSYDVHGIVNGLDYDLWDPATDRHLPRGFDENNLGNRIRSKRALQKRAGFAVRDDVPLLAMVSRLDHQKGVDLLEPVLERLIGHGGGDVQFVVLGTGSKEYERMFTRLGHRHRSRIKAFLAYSAELAPLVYAGSDMFLMPSRFEPCGLGQLIAMRYGSVPVVRATGGLADTVQEGVTGFSFREFSAEALLHAVQRAISIYKTDRASWRRLQRNGMMENFSLERSANGYQQLYDWAIARVRNG